MAVLQNIFKTKTEEKGRGLFATVEELTAQRRYALKARYATRKDMTTARAGDVKSVFKGRGMEFEEIRAYAFGDDVRDIDWRVTARKQVPYTKLFAEEKDREVYVILDLSPQMLFGTKRELKTVAAAKATARIGWQSLLRKDRFGCLLSDGKDEVLLKAQNTQANLMMIFKKIADMSQNVLNAPSEGGAAFDLMKAVKLLQQNIKHKAIVFVVSDFADFGNDGQKALALLAKKAEVTCVKVYDVIEKYPPQDGEYMAQQGRRRLVFSTRSEKFRQAYVQYFAEKFQTIRAFCRKFNLHYAEISTNGD